SPTWRRCIRAPSTAGRPAGSASLEAADAEGSGSGCLPLHLAHVGGRVFVHDGDSGEVPRLEGGEGDGELMAALQPGQAAEVGQASRSSSAMLSLLARFAAPTAPNHSSVPT